MSENYDSANGCIDFERLRESLSPLSPLSPIQREIKRRHQMKLDIEKSEDEAKFEAMTDRELELMAENEDLKKSIALEIDMKTHHMNKRDELEKSIEIYKKFIDSRQEVISSLRACIRKHWCYKLFGKPKSC